MFSWVKLLLAVIGIVRQTISFLQTKKLISAGESIAVAAALGEAHSAVLRSIVVADEAKKQHDADPTDKAFDNEFKRKD